MVKEPTVTVGDGREDDIEALIALAKARLPIAVSHMEEVRHTRPSVLSPARANTIKLSCSVARIGDEVVGFAYALPLQLPPGAGIDFTVGNLRFLAVAEEHQGKQVGVQLIRHTEARRKVMGSEVLIAHIPNGARGVYEQAGWTVLPPDLGFAWQLPGGQLTADYANDGPPFDCLAYKLLGRMIFSFTFEHRGGQPFRRAAEELMEQVKANRIHPSQLTDATRGILAATLFCAGQGGGNQ